MKLLLDQNLSFRLARKLSDEATDVSHVREHGLQAADDETIWNFAAERHLTIVSKDSDFHQRSFVLGHPPKVIWIRTGNCSTAALEAILRTHRAAIEEFVRNPDASFLELG